MIYTATAETRYLSAVRASWRLDSDWTAVLPASPGPPRLATTAEARMLSELGSPRTLGAHLDAVVTGGPRPGRGDAPNRVNEPRSPGNIDSVEAILQGMIERGLLVSEEAVLKRFRSRADRPRVDAPLVAIDSICIPTRDRPEMLNRALGSYLTSALRNGRSPEFLVIDDSGEPSAASRGRRIARELGLVSGLPIRYADRESRYRFAMDVAAVAGLPSDLVAHALVGEAGAARNCIQLETRGRCYLQIDDDTVADTFLPPQTERGVRLTSEGDANDHWYFASLAEAVEAAEPVDADPLALHERVLGRPLVDLVEDPAEPLRLGRAVGRAWFPGGRGPAARIAVSYGGTVGHCGGPGLPEYRLKVPDPSFRRLVRDERAFEASYHSMQMIRCAPCLTISDVDYCVTANMAVDNRIPLPPHPPRGWSEDTLFGIVRSAMHPDGLAAFIPYAVLHDAGATRPPGRPSVLSTRTNDLVIELVARFVTGRIGGGDGLLADLGRHIRRIAELGEDDFLDVIGAVEFSRAATAIRKLERLSASRPDAPGFWRAKVRSYRRSWRSLLLECQPGAPADLPGPVTERRKRFRRLLLRYAQILEAWPAITQAADRLRASGRRLAECP